MKTITIFLALFLLSCNQANNCTANEERRRKEIDNIIESLIQYEDLANPKSVLICERLKKSFVNPKSIDEVSNESRGQEIRVVKLPEKPPLFDYTEIFVEKLTLETLNGKPIFNPKDSISLRTQNYCLMEYNISRTTSKKLNLTTFENLDRNRSNLEYIILSIPVFSSDNKKAYMEIDYHLKHRSFGVSFYLEKVGSKWKIIDSTGNWSGGC